MKPAAIKPLRVSPTSSGSIRVESKISAPSIDSAKPIARTTAASRPDNLISRTGKFFSSKHADFLKHARSCFKVDRAVKSRSPGSDLDFKEFAAEASVSASVRAGLAFAKRPIHLGNKRRRSESNRFYMRSSP